MRISESQLRRVVINEVEKMNTRSFGRLHEQYTPGVKAADGSVTWKDASAVNGKQWSYSWNPATKVVKTALVGQQLAVIDPAKNAKVYAAVKTQGERAQMEAGGAAPAAAVGAAGGAAGGAACQLPSYKDSLTTALAKTALAGAAAATAINIIIFGDFYRLQAQTLAAAAKAIRTAGSGDGIAGMAAAGLRTLGNMVTGGGSEAINESMAGLLDGLSQLISGTTSARIKFSRDCNLQNFAAGIGGAFSSAISSIISGVQGGVQSIITFFTTDAAKALALLQKAGLVALGITVATFTAILGAVAAFVKAGAAAVQSAISSALLAAGAALTAAGGSATKAGQAAAPMPESRDRMIRSYKRNVRELAREMNEAAKISSILSRLNESTRKSILSSMILS